MEIWSGTPVAFTVGQELLIQNPDVMERPPLEAVTRAFSELQNMSTGGRAVVNSNYRL
jgi:hypothetical protein